MKKRSAGRARPSAEPRRGRELRLHEGFVGARALIGTPYLASADRREEYEREIAPRTEESVARVLGRLYGAASAAAVGTAPGTETGAGPGPGPGPDTKTARPLPRRCLDLGAGTGAASRTLKRFFSALPIPHEVEVVGVDRVAAEGLVVADLSQPGALPPLGARFDLIVEAHLLNELLTDRSEDERPVRIAGLVRRWIDDHLAPAGVVILIEPALRETSRLLLAVRNELLAGGALHVLAPCLTDAPCPALAKPRDWCHDAATSATAGTRVDFSYVVLQRSSAVAAADEVSAGLSPAAMASHFRVVSDLLSEKGRLRIYGCGPAGRVPLIRLDKHGSSDNAAFAELGRGELVSITDTAEAQDGRRVLPDSRVSRERG